MKYTIFVPHKHFPMTKAIFCSCIAILLAPACKNAIKNTAQVVKEEPMLDTTPKVMGFPMRPRVVTKNLKIITREDLYGFWVGMFEPDHGDREKTEKDYISTGEHVAWDRSNKISLSIDSIADDSSVFGHSVVAGNLRPFQGWFRFRKGQFQFETVEPGDDKYDGTFSFAIALSGDKIEGKWKAYGKVETPARKYILSKKIFEYDPNQKLENIYIDWEKTKSSKVDPKSEDYYDKAYFMTTERVYEFNPSVRVLKSRELERLSKADIYILRNSIYARHGYSFMKRALRAFFDSQGWYMPVHVDIKKDLTEIEKTNIRLLMRYEKNAEEYYDDFGRG
jgi:hypothetical protein